MWCSVLSWQPSLVGFYITLRDAEGHQVRDMADPFGGVFDASGDFDDLLNPAASPLLAAIDPDGTTTLPSTAMDALAAEVDALLADIPERVQGPGRRGMAWRGLVRFRVMVDACRSDGRFTLTFVGD